MTDVLVIGGGIAGMSAAMELCADHDVTVLERRPIAGGKARTWTDPDFNVFREHSLRVFHATYHNTFDTMRRVPTNQGRTIRDDLMPYVTKQDVKETGSNTFQRWLRTYAVEGSIGWAERVRLSRDVARLFRALSASDDRLRRRYSESSFEEIFLPRPDGTRGLLFQGLKDMSQVEYSADRVNPDVKIMLNFLDKHFMHGIPGVAWNALAGPTSDTYIEPWKSHLEEAGVVFRTDMEALSIELDQSRERVAGVVANGSDGVATITADSYVVATPSNVTLDLTSDFLGATAPSLERLRDVRRVWNNGAIIYSGKPIRCIGGYYMWHPWRVAATTYAGRWRTPFDITQYGVGETRGRIREIISYVITDWFAPGVKTKKPASECSPDEIYEELCHMSLDDPTVMPEFSIDDHVYPVDTHGNQVRCMVDGSLIYDRHKIVENEDPLAHFPPGYSLRMPGQETEIPNLFVAGCHTYNAFGCGDSMEGANETGRRAANAILHQEGSSRRATVLEGRTHSATGRVFEFLRRTDGRIARLTSRET